MASRRDQLQSYQFLTHRVISAFVMRETDPPQSPLRRGIGAIFAGVMIAVLVAGGCGVVGVVTKTGGGDWRIDGVVVIERETGASYVYRDGRLHPTLNYASALLASSFPAGTEPFRQPRASLAGVPRGTTIGIPGAPDSLPAADKVVGMPWSLCSGPATGGGSDRTMTLGVGLAPAGALTLGEGQALLVTGGNDGATYLVWRGRRYRLVEPQVVVPALFGELVAPVRAGAAFLNGLPPGVDIGPFTVDIYGEPSASVAGRKVGDLLVAQTGSGPQHYLVFDDGVAPITPLQRDILVSQHPGKAIEVALTEASTAPRSNRLVQAGVEIAAPETTPRLAKPVDSDLVCAQISTSDSSPVVSIGGSLPDRGVAAPVGTRGEPGASLADQVLVPAGRIAVARATATAGSTGGTIHLITDLGVRHAVPSAEVLGTLGYAMSQAVDVPASLLNLIPAGPALDPVAAGQPASTGGARY